MYRIGQLCGSSPILRISLPYPSTDKFSLDPHLAPPHNTLYVYYSSNIQNIDLARNGTGTPQQQHLRQHQKLQQTQQEYR